MIFCERGKVIENQQLALNHFKLILEAPSIAPHVQAGQFIQMRCSKEYDPLLPRPMSVYRVDGQNLEVLYEVVGRGTEFMAHVKKGGTLEVVGPLGRPFWKAPGAEQFFFIAGGIGLAPFYALAEQFSAGTRSWPGPGPLKRDLVPLRSPALSRSAITVLFGARTKSRVICEDEFIQLGVGFEVSTDDGSYGFHGRITQLLEKKLSELGRGSRSVALYACGPNVMMREASRVALSRNIPCQVSLDEPMACGFGICFGCAVKIRKDSSGDEGWGMRGGFDLPIPHDPSLIPHEFTYKLACKDGPVFEARDVTWE